MDDRAIGILDSGVGGLTIWKEILKELPNESTIYIGDSRNTPYGSKSAKEILSLARKMFDFCKSKKVKLIVVACNTITVNAIDKLRVLFPEIPIIGTVPVIKTAVAVSKNKKIGVLSTTTTAGSDYQKKLLKEYAKGIKVVNLGTDRLVPLVEQGIFAGKKLQGVLSEELAPFVLSGVDVVALGCTHFPFLRVQMQDFLGREVALLDSGPAVARQVKRILENNKIQSSSPLARHAVYTTGNREILATVFEKAALPQATIEYVSLE